MGAREGFWAARPRAEDPLTGAEPGAESGSKPECRVPSLCLLRVCVTAERAGQGRSGSTERRCKSVRPQRESGWMCQAAGVSARL